jgi:hypothetical protein
MSLSACFARRYLDSHYYHVFASTPRAFSPRQHIAYVCEHNRRDLEGCCEGEGLRRIMGEWSASFDTLVCAKLDDVMASYAATGKFLEAGRQIPPERQKFLRKFVEAQMVVWEGDVSDGWFYWNFKMEGGAFGACARASERSQRHQPSGAPTTNRAGRQQPSWAPTTERGANNRAGRQQPRSLARAPMPLSLRPFCSRGANNLALLRERP